MKELFKSEELAHMLGLWEEDRDRRPDLTAHMWDKRVANWKENFWKQNVENGKAMNRVRETAAYLRGQGLLGPDGDVIDIGCGPGRFVSEFAGTARSVVGIDISARTIEYARLFTKEQGRENTRFMVEDFCSLDIAGAGLSHAFDLAFCSLSPAVCGLEGLQKFMDLSRSWCCMNTIVSGRHQLHERIAGEVFKRECLNSWDGRQFYTSFNTLYLMGYLPVTSFYRQVKENKRPVTRGFAEISACAIFPEDERTEEKIEKIYGWMMDNQDSEGCLYEKSEFTYGRLLWNKEGTHPYTPVPVPQPDTGHSCSACLKHLR